MGGPDCLLLWPPTFTEIFFERFEGIENPAFVDFIKNIETEETLVQVHDIESPSSETGKNRIILELKKICPDLSDFIKELNLWTQVQAIVPTRARRTPEPCRRF